MASPLLTGSSFPLVVEGGWAVGGSGEKHGKASALENIRLGRIRVAGEGETVRR